MIFNIFKSLFYLILLLVGMGTLSCGETKSTATNRRRSPEPAPPSLELPGDDVRKDLVSPSDGVAFLTVAIPGFETLDAGRRTELYLESIKNPAAVDASDERVVRLLEEIVQHGDGASSGIAERISRYLEQVRLHGGTRDAFTGARLRPTFIPGELAAAAETAIRNGADIDVGGQEGVDPDRLARVEAIIKEIRPLIYGTPSGEVLEESLSSGGGGPVVLADPLLGPRWAAVMDRATAIEARLREVGGRRSAAPWTPDHRIIPAVVLHPGPSGQTVSGPCSFFAMGACLTNGDNRYVAVNLNRAFNARYAAALAGEFGGATEADGLRTSVQFAFQALRETFGYGPDGTEKQPAGWLAGRLGPHAQIIDHLRADLAALHLAADPDVRAAGLVPDDGVTAALYGEFVASVLRLLATSASLDAHLEWRSMKMIVNALIEAGAVRAERSDDGRLTVMPVDMGRCRRAVADLLAKVRRIRFAGDGVGAARLVEQYDFVPAGWTQHLAERFETLDLPVRFAIRYPRMAPVYRDRRLVDMVLDDPSDARP